MEVRGGESRQFDETPKSAEQDEFLAQPSIDIETPKVEQPVQPTNQPAQEITPPAEPIATTPAVHLPPTESEVVALPINPEAPLDPSFEPKTFEDIEALQEHIATATEENEKGLAA